MIEEYTKCMLVDMSNKVLEHLAQKHEKVREGVKSVMGGRVLDYEAKTIKKEGIKEGLQKGRCLDRQEFILESLEETGSVPEDLRRKIMEEEDMEKLKKWSRLAARVMSVEEFLERCQEK